jgi:hypothetical protein
VPPRSTQARSAGSQQNSCLYNLEAVIQMSVKHLSQLGSD